MAPIDIAVAIDDGFAGPLCGMLSTLLPHHDPRTLRLHLLSAGLSTASRQRVDAFVASRGVSLRHHEVPVDQYRTVRMQSPHLTTASLHRLALPALLPDLDRVLYLDTDLLIRRSLVPLFERDLHGAPIGAVMDAFPSLDCQRLGLPDGHGYFNAGVLLLDLAACRATHVMAHALAYVLRHQHDRDRTLYGDQDGLNAVSTGQWAELPATWNFNLAFCATDPGQLAPHLRTALEQGPAIVHFCGRKKPWNRLYALPFQREFLARAAASGVHFPRRWTWRQLGERFSEVNRLRRLRGRYRRAGVQVEGVF